MSERAVGMYGAFDFFAYIIPGTVLVGPLAVLPFPRFREALDAGIVASFLTLVFVYLLGLMVHGVGQWLERTVLLGKKGQPSTYVLARSGFKIP